VYSNRSNFPVVDKDECLKDILSLTDMRRVMLEKGIRKVGVAKDIAREDVVTVTPEDSLHTAIKKVTAAQIRELPVVSGEDP